MKKLLSIALVFIGFTSNAQFSYHNLQFTNLANNWDEAVPMGNGMLGVLIWQKNDRLHFSLDRADLWDLRPMRGLHRAEFNYQWVIGQVKKKDYGLVQQYFDEPYLSDPAPSKIPGCALEFDTKNWGKVTSVKLTINNAHCEVRWANGVRLKTFIHATLPVGWFRFEQIKNGIVPVIIPPAYQSEDNAFNSLNRLGYLPGKISKQGNSITYEQTGWGGFSYEVNIRWRYVNAQTLVGVWSISTNKTRPAKLVTLSVLKEGYYLQFSNHVKWWSNFWDKSSIHIPDTLLEKQWYLEQYKFGSVARQGDPAISLQSIWTADNGRLPPWKGDFHNDVNTQMSYWPAYSSNHLNEAMGLLDFLDKNKKSELAYTHRYFGVKGLAVPGVTTLDGTEMGGWIQYALSPTASSWLAQHYYLQWRYSMNKKFLNNRAYPWIKETASFLENITTVDLTGHRQLPISSSPEINDNSIAAWFGQNTNYDLALMKFVFGAAFEMADSLGRKKEAEHWRKIGLEYDNFALSNKHELMIAPSMNYNQSHRHFSHLMAIYPLGLIKWEDGKNAQTIIKNSIHLIDSIGSANWMGFSYPWLATLKARAKDGDGAAKALTTFSKNFCTINSFDVNYDQTMKNASRPFTLEGNFGFAAGLQEMLLQSYAGFIDIMPAVPIGWKDVSFENLRAVGAFLVSAKKYHGDIVEIKITSEKGGYTELNMPFAKSIIQKKHVRLGKRIVNRLPLYFQPGGRITILNKQITSF